MAGGAAIEHMSALDIAAAIRSRKMSSVEATMAALDRLERAHEKCNAVVSFEREEALAAAEAADTCLSRGEPTGPLHGVPLAHKDMFDRAGKIASWGGNIRAAEPATQDATVLARLKTGGALQIAALHLTEFAYGPIGHNYVLGHARNPWNQAHVSGGSSSGTAMSIATGAIPAGLGSDTAGSLRLPASACGITSLKPTSTLVSPAGAMPLSPSLDAVGPMARDVRDLAVMLGLIAGHDPRYGGSTRRTVPGYAALAERPVKGVRIGIDEALVANSDASVQQRLADAAAALEAEGATRVAIEIDNWRTLDHLAQIVQITEAASGHAPFLRHRLDDYGPQVRTRVEYGHFVSGVDYVTAARARGQMLQRMLDQVYARCDVVMLPNFAGPIPTIAELDVGGGPQLMAALAKVMMFSRPLNYLGLPALTLPYPHVDGEIPNGFQLMGRPFSEGRLLSIGRAYQEQVPVRLAPL
jgi:aspartyl-tRNA(Asn)/glutamyl-tRNA(Gln) amidotransferase subunit A